MGAGDQPDAAFDAAGELARRVELERDELPKALADPMHQGKDEICAS